MNILVINGSPKGKNSITLQTSLFLEKLADRYNFDFIHVGQRIKYYENNMEEAVSKIKNADLIIFSYPVYTFIAPSQLHHFINLMKNCGEDFSGKIVTQISTSKHFYDTTAHRYIEENCFDMGMNVIKGFSADMDDLTTKKGQKEAIAFFKHVLWCARNAVFEKIPDKKEYSEKKYTQIRTKNYIAKNGTVALVCDVSEDDERLISMIEDFKNKCPYEIKEINIRNFAFSGGCLGCFNCATNGKCIYKDGFDKLLRDEIQSSDAIVYAFSIEDHSMGWRFKMYDDRQFCNGHRTVTEGTPFGYIVNGDYENEENLKTIIVGRSEVGHNFLAGVAYTPETLSDMIKRLDYAIENKLVLPRNFYGVGGMKIFRDLIWVMRGLMKADHEFYKKHGVYDFPQKQTGRMLGMCLVGEVMRNPKLKSKMNGKMTEGMLMPYKKVFDDIDKRRKNKK
ncbi:MAG: NAD(P)H-dependent oxidoreductase [Oscillospiraceae bacterium]|nr:NAD(P)H-dependent oxidoreductase [Oscillospiraceae bacterium]